MKVKGNDLSYQKHNFYSFDVQTLPLRMKAPFTTGRELSRRKTNTSLLTTGRLSIILPYEKAFISSWTE